MYCASLPQAWKANFKDGRRLVRITGIAQEESLRKFLHRLRLDMNKVGLRVDMASFVAFDEALNTHPDMVALPIYGSDPHPKQVAQAMEQMILELRKRNPRVVILLIHVKMAPRNDFTGEVDPQVPLLKAELLRAKAARGNKDAVAYELGELKKRISKAVSPISIITEVCVDLNTPGCDAGSQDGGKVVRELDVTGIVAKLLHQHFGLSHMAGLDRHRSPAVRAAEIPHHDGTVSDSAVRGLGISPIGLFTLAIAPWFLYAAAKWAIAERRADERERALRRLQAGKFPV